MSAVGPAKPTMFLGRTAFKFGGWVTPANGKPARPADMQPPWPAARLQTLLGRCAAAYDPSASASEATLRCVSAHGVADLYVADLYGERGPGRCVTVAVEGTDHIDDWLLNVDARRVVAVSQPGGTKGSGRRARAHAGFVQYAQSLWPSVAAHLRRLAPAAVTFTGHSLGGASAELMAFWSQTALPGSPAVRCVTFGAPRVWAGRPPPLPAHHTLRVVLGADVVPMAPSGMRFRHRWPRLWLRRNGSTVGRLVVAGHLMCGACVAQAVGPGSDHDLATYRLALARRSAAE